MNYNEAIEYIHKINWCFCNPGLERIEELCERLGNPQNKLKFIHVAGTNGKGSFCAMLASVLKSAGYKVGLFTSPYVRTFNERMAINGKMVSDKELVSLVEKIKPISDSMINKPTEFELITALAFEYFAENNCDYVVLECGLGGRLDSTNIIKTPVLSVITGIAFDHTSILGNTIEKIAYEKAGIIRKDVPCLWCGEDKRASEVISKRANELEAPFYTVDRSCVKIKSLTLDGTIIDFKDYKNVFIPLLGEYQVFNLTNVLTAVDILKMLGICISDKELKQGLLQVIWHARFEIISKSPLVIADGAHNPQGVEGAVKSVKAYFGDKKLNVITGVMADKDYEYIADQISLVGDKIFCIAPNNPRALDAKEYAELYRKRGLEAYSFETVEGALTSAIENSKKEKKAVICLGSLYMYGDICDCIENISKS